MYLKINHKLSIKCENAKNSFHHVALLIVKSKYTFSIRQIYLESISLNF